MSEPREITQLLAQWKTGDRSVENALVESVYPVLRQLARSQLRGQNAGFTLQATELANEAYVKLLQQHQVDWQNRSHFYAIAATVIRRVVIDHVRSRDSAKRGGGLPFVSLDSITDDVAMVIDDSVDWLGVDAVLTELAAHDSDLARVVELKFFGGLNTEQMAQVMGTSTATVGRQWRYARAWLADRLSGGIPSL